MAGYERLKFALASDENENRLISGRPWKPAVHTVDIQVDGLAVISVEDTFCISCGQDCDPFNGKMVFREEVAKWTTPNASSVQATIDIYSKIKKLFPCAGLTLRLTFLNTEDMQTIFASGVFDEWTYGVVRGTVTSESLGFVMDHSGPQKYLQTQLSTVPRDFQHEKAFNFNIMEYEDAQWVRVEDLMTMRGVGKIELKRTSLNCAHLQKYITHIVECGYPVCKVALIQLDGAVSREVAFHNLLVLELEHMVGSVYFCLIEPSEHRKILIVQFNGNQVRIDTKDIDKHHQRYFKILTVLKRKKEWEAEKKRTEQLEEKLKEMGVNLEGSIPTMRGIL